MLVLQSVRLLCMHGALVEDQKKIVAMQLVLRTSCLMLEIKEFKLSWVQLPAAACLFMRGVPLVTTVPYYSTVLLQAQKQARHVGRKMWKGSYLYHLISAHARKSENKAKKYGWKYHTHTLQAKGRGKHISNTSISSYVSESRQGVLETARRVTSRGTKQHTTSIYLGV